MCGTQAGKRNTESEFREVMYWLYLGGVGASLISSLVFGDLVANAAAWGIATATLLAVASTIGWVFVGYGGALLWLETIDKGGGNTGVYVAGGMYNGVPQWSYLWHN